MSVVDELVAASIRGESMMETAGLRPFSFDPRDADGALARILAAADHSSYHLLLALRRLAPDRYARVPASQAAAILASALGHLTYLNDWGYLDPGGSYDGEAMEALVETGDAAVRALRETIDDDRPAPLFGSEEATLSSLYGYRRKDFAARGLARVRREDEPFDPDPARRDERIAALRRRAGLDEAPD
jgi:hypothetical protein